MGGLKMYTIYRYPVDYPDKYVVRLFINGRPTTLVTLHDTLAAAQDSIPPGLYCLPRYEGDEPHIVEVWL